MLQVVHFNFLVKVTDLYNLYVQEPGLFSKFFLEEEWDLLQGGAIRKRLLHLPKSNLVFERVPISNWVDGTPRNETSIFCKRYLSINIKKF
ncbi:hypothetical protein NPIL_364921 [Nephila pilipes]|uniref:Uncharacterized protein n=1 Tax=Nephila pilipes TaxID=299642 RepID=A0A8X6UML1_NEPPI|nr:hypothetical protein NPIL_364921 [Nephila pilipes]